jgi:hypothetical protein
LDRLHIEPGSAAGLCDYLPANFLPGLFMLANKKLFQRIVLAFTTAFFLACAAQISSADAASVSSTGSSTIR